MNTQTLFETLDYVRLAYDSPDVEIMYGEHNFARVLECIRKLELTNFYTPRPQVLVYRPKQHRYILQHKLTKELDITHGRYLSAADAECFMGKNYYVLGPAHWEDNEV